LILIGFFTKILFYSFSYFKRPRTTKGRSGWMRLRRILPILQGKKIRKNVKSIVGISPTMVLLFPVLLW